MMYERLDRLSTQPALTLKYAVAGFPSHIPGHCNRRPLLNIPALKRSSLLAPATGDMGDQHHPPATSTPKFFRVRESCDRCLIAKVKCGKEKPLCKRCLTKGLACVYSPCMKTGRKSQKDNPSKAASLAQEQTSRPTRIGSQLQSKSVFHESYPLFDAVTYPDLLNSTRAAFACEDTFQSRYHGPLHNRPNSTVGDHNTFDLMADESFNPPDYLHPFMSFFDPATGFEFLAVPISPSMSPNHLNLEHLFPYPNMGLWPSTTTGPASLAHSSSPHDWVRTPFTPPSPNQSPHQQ